MREDAVELAIKCLVFIGEDTDRLGRFLAQSGVGPEKIRESANDPAFLGGVLDFILLEDSSVLEFADWAEIDPAALARARYYLPGAAPE